METVKITANKMAALCCFYAVPVFRKVPPPRKPADLSLYAVLQYLKTTPNSDLVQNKLIPTSLGTDWIENERFELVFAKN